MTDQPAETIRKPRVDAVRNRERVLEAAKAVFSAGGPDASLEAVAKRAGVGIGTLYRHFPTREALFEAVYRREVEQLSELAEQLKSASAPVDALRRWLRANVELVATKKGMIASLALAVQGSSELYVYSFDRLTINCAAAVGCVRRRSSRPSHRSSANIAVTTRSRQGKREAEAEAIASIRAKARHFLAGKVPSRSPTWPARRA